MPNPRLDAYKKSAANAAAEKVVVKSPTQSAENEYSAMVNAGKVGPNNVNAVKQKIANKWGVWPNGGTN